MSRVLKRRVQELLSDAARRDRPGPRTMAFLATGMLAAALASVWWIHASFASLVSLASQ